MKGGPSKGGLFTMIEITLSQLPAALGYAGSEAVDDCIRQVVRKNYGYSQEVDSLPVEYSKGAKQTAIFDFELETGILTSKAEPFRVGQLNLKADAICSDGTPLIIHTPYKSNGEFESAELNSKLKCKAQFLMSVMQKEKCHIYQWSEQGQMLDTMEFSSEYIDKHSFALNEFFVRCEHEAQYPEKHLSEIYSSRSANSAIKAYEKAMFDIAALQKKCDSIRSSLLSEMPDGEYCVKNHLVKKTNGSLEIIK
ncbi:hypothetical protein [Listonella phage phiHSIC]|uniref:hypothetical protein n=1 Tax=Listonella phage phiHSIC TaxID=310539 RepID=UPI00004C7425|nr:hypothetical protein LPPPVgp41 [Listonella phage phiHSIC]AAW67541.1 hypothetical protein [Listonella phage phiHSIC]